MKQATLKVLQGSIEKWEKIVSGKDGDRGAENCPLCWRFWNAAPAPHQCERKDGEKCPVHERTGQPGCFGSPYSDWLVTHWGEACGVDLPPLKGWAAKTKHQKTAAKAELEFLKSLLP